MQLGAQSTFGQGATLWSTPTLARRRPSSAFTSSPTVGSELAELPPPSPIDILDTRVVSEISRY